MRIGRAIVAATAIFLLAGCGASRYAERLDENSDDFQIRAAVYSYLLQQNQLWDFRGCTALFLKGSDDEVAALMRKFPDHVPPIKATYHVEAHPNRTPMDKDTGKPAMILSVDAGESKADRAEAIGSWYSGALVSGHSTFALIKTNGHWSIEAVK